MGPLAARDHAPVVRPALHLIELGQLDDLHAISDPAVELPGPHPVLFLGQEKPVPKITAGPIQVITPREPIE
jgi:hypothetical protein